MKKIFLLGYMGSGKSTLGKLLANSLKLAFIDLDTCIEQRRQKTIPQIFEEKGEAEFRKIEQAALLKTASIENAIISTGGGTPCFFDNMNFMNERGLTIYLQSSPETLLENLREFKANRPLIRDKSDEGLLAFIKENLEKRDFYYTQAKLIINPKEDLEQIIEKIKCYLSF